MHTSIDLTLQTWVEVVLSRWSLLVRISRQIFIRSRPRRCGEAKSGPHNAHAQNVLSRRQVAWRLLLRILLDHPWNSLPGPGAMQPSPRLPPCPPHGKASASHAPGQAQLYAAKVPTSKFHQPRPPSALIPPPIPPFSKSFPCLRLLYSKQSRRQTDDKANKASRRPQVSYLHESCKAARVCEDSLPPRGRSLCDNKLKEAWLLNEKPWCEKDTTVNVRVK